MNIKLYVISIFKHAPCCILHMLMNKKDIGRYRSVFSSESLVYFVLPACCLCTIVYLFKIDLLALHAVLFW